MEIESTLTRKAYAKVVLAIMLRSKSNYFLAALGIVMILASFLLGSLSHNHQSESIKSLRDYGIGFLAFAVLYDGAWFVYQCFFSRNNRRYFGEKRLFTFREENILVTFSRYEQVIKWEAFTDWNIVADCYLLREFDGNTIDIPCDDIPDNKIDDFENLLDLKISKTKTTMRTDAN